jgi:hypothetical protein
MLKIGMNFVQEPSLLKLNRNPGDTLSVEILPGYFFDEESKNSMMESAIYSRSRSPMPV